MARWLVANRSAERGALGVGEVVGVGRTLERAHDVFGDAVVDRLRVADRHAAAALVVERDAQADQLDQPARQRAAVVDGIADRAESGRDLGPVGDDPADAELHAHALVEVVRVDAEVDGLDAGHGRSSVQPSPGSGVPHRSR
jgi:hypothetical protein